jgi:tricorn protease
VLAVGAWHGCATAVASEPYRGPFLCEGATIHGRQIVFACGGELWIVDREGGTAERLSGGEGHEAWPCYSPDGSHVAFLRRSDRLSGRPAALPEDPPPTVGVYDVYVRTMATGDERRLTYHPDRDFPVGWTPDSQRVLFHSHREGIVRLFTMGMQDQLPTPLPLPAGYTGCISPDGKRMAYLPRSLDYHFSEFRYYRGGKCAPLWLVELESGAIQRITDGSFNVRDPMWIGDRIYFLSDADGRFDLYVYETTARAIRKLTNLARFGARGAAADGSSVVLVGDGSLQWFDLESEAARPVPIAIPRDDAALRPRVVNAVSQVQAYALGHDGKRAVVCARGDVFFIDPATGKAANVTKSSGVAERDAQLSPDGGRLAYFSDATGEYALHVRNVNGESVTALAIEQPSYCHELTWSPDGKFIAFADKHLAVWMADLAAGSVQRIDHSGSSSQGRFALSWSADSRYLAYAKYGSDRLPRIHVYDARARQTQAITPEGCHAVCPAFDAGGRYLYFLSSPNAAASDYGWSVMAGVLSQPLVVRRLNAVVLRAADPTPVIGRSPHPMAPWNEPPAATTIDFNGIESRIVPVDLGPHSPNEILAGEPGVVYLKVVEWPASPGLGAPPDEALYRLDLRAPADLKKVLALASSCAVSRDGKAILSGAGGSWRLATFQGSKATVRPVPLAALAAPVDPAREWQQILHETWRLVRDYLYDPGHHGLDWADVERHYREFLPGVRTREELNVLLRRMIGHVSVSHSGAGGGDVASNLNEPEPIGLLGADLEVADGMYRVKRVLRGGTLPSMDPPVHSPLAQLGAEVADGEYLLAIDDEPLDASRNIYDALRGKASRSVQLTVGPMPDRKQARSIRVVPLTSESALRMADWAHRNRQTVETLSGGKLGYFCMPTYGPGDIPTFLRGFFANRSKPGMVIDQRHNGGGITPDYFIEMLARRPLYYYRFRDGDDLAVPVNGRAAGATVLLIDDDNASAAETFALMFQLGKVGPLVGTRTFGAGIGPYGTFASQVPPLIDGGRLRIPARGAYEPRGTWGIENEGVRPDVLVDITPADWRAGRDPQLEAAVQAGLEAAEKEPSAAPRRPKFPVHPRDE